MDQDEQKPTLKLRTDCGMSMTSELTVTVDKSLARVIFDHEPQMGSAAKEFHVFPSDIVRLAEFLNEAAWWMHSGYKDEKKPESRDYT